MSPGSRPGRRPGSPTSRAPSRGRSQRAAPAISPSGTGRAAAAPGRSRPPRPCARRASGTSVPTLVLVETVTPTAVVRARDYVAVRGSDARNFLQRMVSNDVDEAPCSALLLTPKARVIAPLVVVRRSGDDYLLLTEPSLGDAVRSTLLRARFAAKVEIEPEEHTSTVVFGGGDGIPNDEYGVPAVEVLDDETPAYRCATAALGSGDRRSRAPGGSRFDRHPRQLHEGLLPGPRADRAAPPPREGQPRAARARGRGGAGARDRDRLRR